MSSLWGGLALSAIIAAAAYRLGALTASGALGAVVVGSITFGLGGYPWAAVLIAFFVAATLLSRFDRERKKPLAEKFAKGERRDLGQVLANGGLPALLASVQALQPDPIWWAAFLGSLAAVSADTWATELGVLSPTPPRLITNRVKVPRGTSGGITPLGLAASLLGAALIASLGALLDPHPTGSLADTRVGALFVSVWAAGMAGSLIDSWLGATLQAIYYCPLDGVETERIIHVCGQATRWRRGWRWVDNDGVNFLASLSGGLIAWALFARLGGLV